MEKLLVEELCSYLEKRGSKLIFLPHSFHPTDMQANDYEFMKQFLKPGREICENIQEVYDWYKEPMQPLSVRMKGEDSGEDYKHKLIISMRLHSIILSYVYGIEQIVLSYSQKTEELLKKLEN